MKMTLWERLRAWLFGSPTPCAADLTTPNRTGGRGRASARDAGVRTGGPDRVRAEEDRAHHRPRCGRLSADHPRGDPGGRQRSEPVHESLVRPPRFDPAGRRSAHPAHRPGDGHPGLDRAEQLVEIHSVGAEMDRVRPTEASIAHQAGLTGEAAVQAQKEERARIKARKKAEAAERKQKRVEAVAWRKANDIVFLGRGVSGRLGERTSRDEDLLGAGLPVMSTPAELRARIGTHRFSLALARLPRGSRHADALRPLHHPQEERRDPDAQRAASLARPGPAPGSSNGSSRGFRPSPWPMGSCPTAAS